MNEITQRPRAQSAPVQRTRRKPAQSQGSNHYLEQRRRSGPRTAAQAAAARAEVEAKADVLEVAFSSPSSSIHLSRRATQLLFPPKRARSASATVAAEEKKRESESKSESVMALKRALSAPAKISGTEEPDAIENKKWQDEDEQD